MYQQLSDFSARYFSKQRHILFKWFFNLSPMYRRTTGRVIEVAPDFHRVVVRIPISYKNRNYAGTIFGGSLFAATDPIYMVQLIQILGKDYVVWDKSSFVRFRRPARTAAFAVFEFSLAEIKALKEQVAQNRGVDHVKSLALKSQKGELLCQIDKTIYVAEKSYYKEKVSIRQPNSN